MEGLRDIFQMCRLCLANNEVNVPIFGEQSDIRQISLKISCCLPVKIAADDLLPKNICKDCTDKLELLYTFWNSSQEAEKKLQAWVQQISINNASETISVVAKQVDHSGEIAMTAEVKEETEDSHDKIIINQSFDADEDVDEEESEEASPPKRMRHSPTIRDKISNNKESDCDEYDVDCPELITKVEDESHLNFVELPDTSVKEQQTGPSEVRKDEGDAPWNLFVKEEINVVEENLFEKIKQEKGEEKGSAFNKPASKQKFNLCEYCDKTYKRRSSLIIHKTSHTGQKVYQCDQCPKTYSQPKNFTYHYAYNHIDKSIFKCKICNKTFHRKVHLTQHQQIHAQKEEFVCGYCGKTYWTKSPFRQHIAREFNLRQLWAKHV